MVAPQMAPQVSKGRAQGGAQREHGQARGREALVPSPVPLKRDLTNSESQWVVPEPGARLPSPR